MKIQASANIFNNLSEVIIILRNSSLKAIRFVFRRPCDRQMQFIEISLFWISIFYIQSTDVIFDFIIWLLMRDFCLPFSSCSRPSSAGSATGLYSVQ
jgi:hypothetical protein